MASTIIANKQIHEAYYIRTPLKVFIDLQNFFVSFDIIGHSKTSNDNNNTVAIKDQQSQNSEIDHHLQQQQQQQQQLLSTDTLLEGNHRFNKHNNNNNNHQNRKHNQDKGHYHHHNNIDKNIDDFIDETTNNENFDSVNLKRFKKEKQSNIQPLVALDAHVTENDNHDKGNNDNNNLINDSKITTNNCQLLNIHLAKQQQNNGDDVERKLISSDYSHHHKRSSIDIITRETIAAFEQNVQQESIDNGHDGNSCRRKNSIETNGHHHQTDQTQAKTFTNQSTINHYSPASMFDVKFKSYHNSNNNNNNQDNLFVSTSTNNNIGKNNFSHFINCSPNNNSFNSPTTTSTSTILNGSHGEKNSNNNCKLQLYTIGRIRIMDHHGL
ncbi:hypothetical protein DERF_002827 [Dermatophagoides farinae]|uniref:Uncharacterized protein n=1 Tax=Dermatophagoides farinae TaxID=6954 RepID=A0A922ID45_DERFA|nr:hypothetical protein DERF_002827 [Dermatophagoides farinae]